MLLHWQHCSRVGVTWFTVYVTRCSVCRSRFLSLSAFSLCQLLLLLLRSFSGSVFVLLHLTKMSHRRILFIIFIFIFIFTPWSRVLWQKVTGFQQVKKFLIFYGIPRFNTALTSARYLSLCWARSSQYIHHNPLPDDPSEHYPPSTPGSPKLSLS